MRSSISATGSASRRHVRSRPLIQLSAELGSSITEALRVYSDDMRHKRLSRAEEKAYAVPAKLTVPMMVCIFPVLFVVILLPVFVRLHVGSY
jgi:tight adherence protein C